MIKYNFINDVDHKLVAQLTNYNRMQMLKLVANAIECEIAAGEIYLKKQNDKGHGTNKNTAEENALNYALHNKIVALIEAESPGETLRERNSELYNNVGDEPRWR